MTDEREDAPDGAPVSRNGGAHGGSPPEIGQPLRVLVVDADGMPNRDGDTRHVSVAVVESD